jgi:hypothetical protein
MAEETLSVVLQLKDQFSRAMDKVGQNLNKFKQRFDEFGKRATIGLVAVSAAFGALARKAVLVGARLDELSRKTGLSVDRLQELDVVAKLNDTSMEALALAMKNLAKRASDASLGLAEAKRTFEGLGISVTNSDGTLRNINELFKETITAMAKTTDKTKAMALAQEAFGRSGFELLPLLSLTNAELEAQFELAKNSTKLSKEQVQNLDQLGDTFTFLSHEVAQATAILFDWVSGLLGAGGESRNFAESVIRAFGRLKIFLGAFFFEVEGFFRKTFELGIPGIVSQGITGLIELARSSITSLLSLAGIVLKFIPGLGDAIEKSINAVNAAAQAGVTVIQEWIGVKEKNAQIDKETTDRIAELIGTTEQWIETTTRGIIGTKKMADAMKDLKDESTGASDAIKEPKEGLMRIEAVDLPAPEKIAGPFDMAVESMASSFSDFVTSVLSGGENITDGLKGFFNSVKTSFARMIADMASKAIFSQIFGGLFGGSAQGGGGAAPAIPGQAVQSGGGFGGSILGPAVAGLSMGAGSQSPSGGALFGALSGLAIGGPVGALVGGVSGLAGGIFGEDQKKEAEKEQQKAILQQQQAQLRELAFQRDRARDAIMETFGERLGGGLLDPEAVGAVASVLSQGISDQEVESLTGIPTEANFLARQAGQASVNVGGINISANISGSYDVQDLANDIGGYILRSLTQSSAGGHG